MSLSANIKVVEDWAKKVLNNKRIVKFRVSYWPLKDQNGIFSISSFGILVLDEENLFALARLGLEGMHTWIVVKVYDVNLFYIDVNFFKSH